jgi:peptide/nickel transport system substrate-binding protein
LERRVTRRRALAVGAGLCGAAALLAACSDSSDNKAGNESRRQAAQGTADPRAQQSIQPGMPRPGGTFRARYSGDPAGLDPHTNTSFRVQEQAAFPYSRMLKFKADADPKVAYDFEVEPDLAASFEQPGDGATLILKIRPNANFHDIPPVAGRTADSEDVAFSLDCFRNEPKNANRGAFGTPERPIVTGVETPDSKTVVIKLAKPYGPILNLFANPQYLWILPKEVGAGTVDPAKVMIGTGPFVFESYQPSVEIRMRRNPGYFVQGRPYIDLRSIPIIPENAQGKAQFQAERLDAEGISFEDKPEVEQSNPKARWITTIPETIPFIAFQLRGDSPWRDERLRKATSMLFDRDAMLQLSWGGQGYWHNYVPAHLGRWRLDPKGPEIGDTGMWFQANPREARHLLTAAGFPDGVEVRYIYANNAYGERFNQWAEAVAGMLKEGGVKTQITTQDYNREYIASDGTFFGRFEGMFFGLQTPFPGPHDYLFNMLHSQSRRNHGGVSDPRLDEMIDREVGTVNQDERLTLVKEIQKYANEKMYYTPGFIGPGFVALQPWVKGYKYSASYGSGTETGLDVWLDR